jgi:hypothetical protein
VKSLLKSMVDGFLDLYRLAPMAPDHPTNSQLPGPAQDAANLAGDWQRVGDYLRNAMAAEWVKARPVRPESASSSE